MRSPTALREFYDADACDINRLAVRGFQEHSSSYSDWPAMGLGIRENVQSRKDRRDCNSGSVPEAS